MHPALLALQLSQPLPVEMGPAPTLGDFGRSPLTRPVPTWVMRHGPDGPDDVPEDGYEFKPSKSDKPTFMWIGLGAVAISGLTAANARSQSYVMREATTMAELDAAYTHQKRMAYATYGLLGAGALCMILEVPF